MDEIKTFQGKYRFLSNFYPSPMEINNHLYPTVEHWYQASKALDEKDHHFIRKQKSPNEAKQWGKSITIRPGWNNVRIRYMILGVWEKFAQNLDLRQLLIETHPKVLIEGNDWGDQFWGVSKGAGENHLGKILMLTRTKIMNDLAR
jgi:N-glycosidase YbiA